MWRSRYQRKVSRLPPSSRFMSRTKPLNISGMRSSRPKVNAAAVTWRRLRSMNGERVAHKGARPPRARRRSAVHCRDRPPRSNCATQPVDRIRRRAAGLHRHAIQLKVADVPTVVDVALFTQHDFVHQVAALGRAAWQPGHVHTGQAALQRLEQAHEIPYREDVRLHEKL